MQYVYAIALMLASMVLQAIFAPRPKTESQPTPGSLKDFDVPTVADGTPQAVVFGEVWCGDWTVLWYGDFAVESIPAKSTGGGKK